MHYTLLEKYSDELAQASQLLRSLNFFDWERQRLCDFLIIVSVQKRDLRTSTLSLIALIVELLSIAHSIKQGPSRGDLARAIQISKTFQGKVQIVSEELESALWGVLDNDLSSWITNRSNSDSPPTSETKSK